MEEYRFATGRNLQLPFESDWSRYNLFFDLNACSSGQIERRFRKLRKQHARVNNQELPETIRKETIHHFVEVVTDCRSGIRNPLNHWISWLWPNSQTSKRILRACPRCLEKGYHAELYNVLILNECPIHGSSLHFQDTPFGYSDSLRSDSTLTNLKVRKPRRWRYPSSRFVTIPENAQSKLSQLEMFLTRISDRVFEPTVLTCRRSVCDHFLQAPAWDKRDFETALQTACTLDGLSLPPILSTAKPSPYNATIQKVELTSLRKNHAAYSLGQQQDQMCQYTPWAHKIIREIAQGLLHHRPEHSEAHGKLMRATALVVSQWFLTLYFPSERNISFAADPLPNHYFRPAILYFRRSGTGADIKIKGQPHRELFRIQVLERLETEILLLINQLKLQKSSSSHLRNRHAQNLENLERKMLLGWSTFFLQENPRNSQLAYLVCWNIPSIKRVRALLDHLQEITKNRIFYLNLGDLGEPGNDEGAYECLKAIAKPNSGWRLSR